MGVMKELKTIVASIYTGDHVITTSNDPGSATREADTVASKSLSSFSTGATETTAPTTDEEKSYEEFTIIDQTIKEEEEPIIEEVNSSDEEESYLEFTVKDDEDDDETSYVEYTIVEDDEEDNEDGADKYEYEYEYDDRHHTIQRHSRNNNNRASPSRRTAFLCPSHVRKYSLRLSQLKMDGLGFISQQQPGTEIYVPSNLDLDDDEITQITMHPF